MNKIRSSLETLNEKSPKNTESFLKRLSSIPIQKLNLNTAENNKKTPETTD